MKPNPKKGAFSLLDCFSYLIYFLAFWVAVMILSVTLTGCGHKNYSVDEKIKDDFSVANTVRADLQLDSMLRTKIPSTADLGAKFDWMKGYQTQKFAGVFGMQDGDFDKVKVFLSQHPELTENQDYAGFIRGLKPLYDSETAEQMKKYGMIKETRQTQITFTAVTAVMFMRSLKHKSSGSSKSDEWYYLPGISVDYNPANMDPRVGINTCEYVGNQGPNTLCTEYIGDIRFAYLVLPAGTILTHVVQAIPLADGSIAKVDFGYPPETVSTLPTT